jgi:hypothetical protein
MTNQRSDNIKQIREGVKRIIEAEYHTSDNCQSCHILDFPDPVIAGIAGHFTDLFSQHLEVPKEFLFMGFLTCLGTILGGRLTIESELKPQPRLYTVFLGESSDDRKSTGIRVVTDFFEDFFAGKFNQCWGVGSAEGLQKVMKEGEGVVLCFDEFKQFINKCKIEASVLLQCVNSLFESNRWESQLRKTGVTIRKGYLSILAASTIQTYQNIWTGAFTDIGFTNRLWIVPASSERKYAIPLLVPKKEKQIIANRLSKLLRELGKGKALQIRTNALKAYESWYSNLPRSVHAKRLDTYALRLMPLLAVNDGKKEVDEETVRKAIALCDWQYHVRQLYDPIDAENTVARLEMAILRNLRAKGPMSERDLKQHTNAHRSGLYWFDMALNNLKKAGEIVLQGGKGKIWAIRAESNL